MDIPVACLAIVVSAVSCGQTDTITDASKRLTPATVVGVSKYCSGCYGEQSNACDTYNM